MKRKVLGFLLAMALFVGGVQVPEVVYAEDLHTHTQETVSKTELEAVSEELSVMGSTAEEPVVVINETGTCNLVPEGNATNPEYKVKKSDGTVLVPDQPGALSYVLNELTESGDTVVLSNTTVELTKNATVKAGVTLLLPYAEEMSEELDDKNSESGQGQVFSTLIIKSGVWLNVDGCVTVAAQTGQINTNIQNVVTGGYSVIFTEEQSMIDVRNGGTLVVDGYIRGDGNLVARNGGTVRDLYTALGYKGGSALAEDLGVYEGQDGESSYPYPFNTTGCSGIEIDAKYYKGSIMYGTTKFYLSSKKQYCGENFLIIGAKGIFRQGEDENSYIERIVEPAEKQEVLDKETIRYVGGGAMSSSALKVSFSGINVAVTTSRFIYPIGSHTTIEVVRQKNMDNQLHIERAFKFLSGSKLVLGDGTSLTLTEEAYPGTFYATIFGKTGGTDSTPYLVFYDGANLIVNGTLCLEERGTLAIRKEGIEIGAAGSIRVACNHEKVTTCVTPEKSGDVTTTIDWSRVDTIPIHTVSWQKNETTHSGKCSVCLDNIEEEHVWGPTVHTPVSCEDDSTDVKTCKVCGYDDVVVLEKAWGHSLEEEWEIQGEGHVKNCTNSGCNYVFTELHDWEILSKIDATYEEEGYESKECRECHVKREGTIPVLVDETSPTVKFHIGATPIKILKDNKLLNTILQFFKVDVPVSIAATDDETGMKKLEYFVSNTKLSETEISLNMEWQEYQGELKFTEDEDYFVYAKATDNSGNVKIAGSDGLIIDRVAAKFDGIVINEVKCHAATVNVIDRYVDKVYVNGEEVTLSKDNTFILQPSSEPYTIKAVDHTGNESVVENVKVEEDHAFSEWTINEDTHQRVCSRCGHVEYGEHDYTPFEILQEGTCDKDVIMGRRCESCEFYQEQVIEALGHQEGRLIEEKDATARQDGYKKFQCLMCGEYITEVIPAKNGATSGSSNGVGPNTGDNTNIVLWISVGLVSLVVMKATRRKKANIFL